MTHLALDAPIKITSQASPADYIDDWSPAIFIPLVEETLDSWFYGRLSWRDILPDHPKKDFDLGGFPMKVIWIKFDPDAQGRMYVNVKYTNGQENRLHIESKRIDITKLTSYYSKENLERMSTPSLEAIKENILSSYKQFDYIYTDTNVWINYKVLEKNSRRIVTMTNLTSIEKLTNMMPDLGAIHYLHQFVYDEIEIMKNGIHKERFKSNAEEKKEQFIEKKKQKLTGSGLNFDDVEYERALEEWKKQYKYEEKLQEEDDLRFAANRAIDTYKKLKEIQEKRISQTRIGYYFIREGADFDNKVREMDNASDAADREISKGIITFYKQGKRILLITNDEGMWSTLCDVRERNSLIPGTGTPDPNMPPQENVARLKYQNFRGHMLALARIDKILASRKQKV